MSSSAKKCLTRVWAIERERETEGERGKPLNLLQNFWEIYKKLHFLYNILSFVEHQFHTKIGSRFVFCWNIKLHGFGQTNTFVIWISSERKTVQLNFIWFYSTVNSSSAFEIICSGNGSGRSGKKNEKYVRDCRTRCADSTGSACTILNFVMHHKRIKVGAWIQ